MGNLERNERASSQDVGNLADVRAFIGLEAQDPGAPQSEEDFDNLKDVRSYIGGSFARRQAQASDRPEAEEGDDTSAIGSTGEIKMANPGDMLPAERSRVGAVDERTEIRLKWGDTFWQLAEEKYGGRHPIEAIYEANGLTPTIVEKNGKKEMISPIYFADKVYVLPAESEIADLRRRFFQRMEGGANPVPAPEPSVPAVPARQDNYSFDGDPDLRPLEGSDGNSSGGNNKPGSQSDGTGLPPVKTPQQPGEGNLPGANKGDPADPPKPEKGDIPPSPPAQPVDPGNGKGQPTNPDGSGKPPQAAGVDLEALAQQLAVQHDQLAATFKKEVQGGGAIGKLFDAGKNTIGTSARERSWFEPGALWSHVFDSDAGSRSTESSLADEQKKIEELKSAAKAHNVKRYCELFQELTGQTFDQGKTVSASLKESAAVGRYHDSQSAGVETIADLGAAVVAGLSLKAQGGRGASALALRLAGGAAIGGATKAGLKQLDGQYASLPRDFLTGSIMGASVLGGELAGSAVSKAIGSRYGLTVTGDVLTARIETQGTGLGIRLLSASAKSGTAGSVFGAIESPGREIVNATADGRKLSLSDLAGKSLQGAGFGFLGGTLLGFTADGLADGFKRLRPSVPRSQAPPEVNGVPLPKTGVTTLDDAGKMLGQEPGALAQKAASDPYGAVSDAVALYEKTGLNIKKVDALSGTPAVPAQFAEALGTVQTVDVLTAEAPMSLSKKVGVVKSTDAYLAANQEKVGASLERIRADSNYQEVVRLKAEQHGAEAARAFEDHIQSGFNRDLKVGVSVARVNSPSLAEADALAGVQSKTESLYLQKAADFFKDMTDPGQRARLNDLVDEIFSKFTPQPISRAELGQMLDSFEGQDRALAQSILEKSAANASDVGVKIKLQALRAELEHAGGQSVPGQVYTLAPDSSGNMIGYLYRKSNSMSMEIHNIDHLAEQMKYGAPSSIVIFDDLSTVSLTAQQKELLSKIPRVYAVDLNAFDKGINAIDLARGPQATAAKLSSLVAEARSIARQNPGLLPSGVASDLLDGAVDRAASQVGPNVKVIRSVGSYHAANLPSAAELGQMPPLDALYRQMIVPKASKEEIASFLSKYAGEEREVAARMLADGAVHNSFPQMVAKATAVHNEVQEILRKSGISTADLRLVVDKDPGGSTHLISYLYGRVNDLSPENFISAGELNKMISSGAARGKAVAYFDDTIYSGSQTTGMLEGNISSFMPFNKVIVGSLGAYEKGLNSIGGTHLAKIGKVSVATAQRHHPFYSSANPFFARLNSQTRSLAQNIGGSGGFGNVQGSLIWSYMYPDNNLEFFGSKFAGGVLRLPGP